MFKALHYKPAVGAFDSRWCHWSFSNCQIEGVVGLRAMLLVQGRGEMALLPAVTAVLLHHSAMDIWTQGNFVSTV